MLAGEFFHGNCCWLEDDTTRPLAGSHILRNALEKNSCLLFSHPVKGRTPADLVNVYARHSYVAFVLSNSCKHYAPLFNFRPPTVNLLNKDLSFHTTVYPERAAQIASVLVSLVLRHRPWKFPVFFGVTGPESTFFSDKVSLKMISAEE